MQDEYPEDRKFFHLVALPGRLNGISLEGVSGIRASAPPYATGLIEEVETAWRLNAALLSCEQVCTFVSQKFGLQWLAKPVLEFVRRYPAARITNYPGELSKLALDAPEEFLKFEKDDYVDWLSSDFSWLSETFGWDRPLLLDAENSLTRARRMSGVDLQ